MTILDPLGKNKYNNVKLNTKLTITIMDIGTGEKRKLNVCNPVKYCSKEWIPYSVGIIRIHIKNDKKNDNKPNKFILEYASGIKVVGKYLTITVDLSTGAGSGS